MDEQQQVSTGELVNMRRTYRYPPWISLLNKIGAVLAILLGLCPLLMSAGSFAMSVGSWPQFAEWMQTAGRIFIFWFLPCLIGVGTVVHSFPDVTVSSAGLETTVLFGIPVHIPWNEVLALRGSPWSRRRRDDRIILVKKLTPWHRLISLGYCLDLRPGLLIMDRMEGYHELVKIIEAHLSRS